MLKKAFTAITISLSIASTCLGAKITYTYANEEYGVWGTGKSNETYDVAIRIVDPALVGKQITSIEASIYPSGGVSATSLWLSKELKVENSLNVPDIVSIPAPLSLNGNLKADLDTPYTITEDGVYAGYSFTVDELNEYTKTPMLLSSNFNENGLYLHTSRTVRKWRNYGVDYLKCSAVISVTLEGDFPEVLVEPKSMETVYGKAGETGTASVELLNCGVETVNEIGYTYNIGNVTKSATAALLLPIKTNLLNTASALLTFELPDKVGEYDLEVTIDKINGKTNSSSNKNASAKLYTVSDIPVHIPVMEEYTYTSCGYCIRGWYAIDKMNKLHGDDFIALAYHRKDPMAIIPESSLPLQLNEWPNATLDRGKVIDPYWGYAKEPFGIEKAWEEARKVFAPATVGVTAQWEGSDHTKIKANSSVNFVIEKSNVDYRLSYVLCLNGLHSTEPVWDQHNYYAEKSEASEVTGTELEILSSWPELINDFHYNEVAVATNDLLGERGIIPENTIINDPIEHSYVFTITNNIKPLVDMSENLYVVAMLIDGKTGKIVNAAKSGLLKGSGIDFIHAQDDPEIIEESYTDILGRNVKYPANGIFIKTVKYSDGSAKSEKVMITRPVESYR